MNYTDREWIELYNSICISVSDEILDEADELFGLSGTSEDDVPDEWYIWVTKKHFNKKQ